LKVKPSTARTDPEIAREAIQELESHVSIPSDKIKLTVEKGWVTLEGTVDWQYQKSLAESAIKKLRGVVGITNNITLKPQVTAERDKVEDRRGRCGEARNWMLAVSESRSTAGRSNCMAAYAPGPRDRRPRRRRGQRPGP